jgi:hypothetical protein
MHSPGLSGYLFFSWLFSHLFFEAVRANGVTDLVHFAGFDIKPLSAVGTFDIHQFGIIVGVGHNGWISP